jgi:penicillin-binding protein 1A
MNISPKFKNRYIFIKRIIEKSIKDNSNIPELLIDSIIKIEDKRFFEHQGIDLYALLRATVNNLTSNRLEGASTIVQQTIRNITNDKEVSLSRKLKEILFAVLINKDFSKNDLINAYLNTYRFGNYVGISTFCQAESYSLNNLTNKESAEIAARLKYPKLSENNYIKFLKRVRSIEKIVEEKSTAIKNN